MKQNNKSKEKLTCQQTVGCFRDRINCVKGEGSSSYLSKGKLSITIGSWLVHVNFKFGCALLAGYESNF